MKVKLVNFGAEKMDHVMIQNIRQTMLTPTMDELKGLGFDLSKVKFVIALIAKRVVIKPSWDAKVDAFKRWDWSE